ncbi:MAG TPA: polyprenyl synthetase family protein [Actinomycetota bacterium]|nr:polyprenyl synthetase family protein [Actinomycetota bacterium]
MTRAISKEMEAPDPILEAEIRKRLEDVEDHLADSVKTETPLVSEAGAYLLSAGGKRFRPMLVLLGGHFGDPTDPRLVPLAVSVELTHLASLYHDDVIDEADSRRGIPSVNARWDNTVAILAGDFLFARASAIAAELGTDVSRLLATTIGLVCEGQIREVQAAGRLEIDEAEYMAVIERKTASLIATSCQVGGLLSGAPTEVVQRLDRFGRALGLAFQLSDDIMDLVSDQSTLGKEPGVDLREGVLTLPLIIALRESEHREELRRLLRSEQSEESDLRRVMEIVRGDGALGRARESVSREVGRALSEAERLPEGSARDALLHLAEYLAVRCGALL